MRHWNRSVSQLGDKALEDAIQEGLIRRFPPSQFPFSIDVVGGHDAALPTVQITNFQRGIKVFERVNLQASRDANEGMVQSIIATVERVISKLVESGKISQP